MAYSIKKAGVAFKLKLDTNADLTGQAANFSSYYIDDSLGTKTDITSEFTEDANTAGLYMVEVTIPTPGDYTIVINNPIIGMDNFSAPLVVVAATIEDVKNEVDTLLTTLNTVATDVAGINGDSIDNLAAVTDKLLNLVDENSQDLNFGSDAWVYDNVTAEIENYDDTSIKARFVNKYITLNGDHHVVVTDFSVRPFQQGDKLRPVGAEAGSSIPIVTYNNITHFINDINTLLTSSAVGLGALAGYTDDIENMLNGTEFLSDGTTANPFYDATNPGALKESTLKAKLEELKTSIQTAITNTQAAVQNDVAAVQTVVSSNKTVLEDAGYGLSALSNLVGVLNSNLTTNSNSILNILNDATNGLVAINNLITTRFDTVDSSLANVDSTMSNIDNQRYNMYI